jgi:esterase
VSEAWVPYSTMVTAEGGAPRGFLLFLHGILGSGGNWRTIARRLTAARPEWGAVLVDLRMHGRSQDAPAPHTVEAAAADLTRLAAHLSGEGKPVRGVIGHSFGGKVALCYRATRPPELLDTWVLDATPSARESPDPDDGALQVLGILEQLPADYPDRPAFVAALTGRGLSRALADWLAMNLEPAGGAFHLRLDLSAIRALLTDYYARDLWSALEDADLPGTAHVVVAGRSRALDEADRSRLAHPHIIPDAGHWLHHEAPDALIALLSGELAAIPP